MGQFPIPDVARRATASQSKLQLQHDPQPAVCEPVADGFRDVFAANIGIIEHPFQLGDHVQLLGSILTR